MSVALSEAQGCPSNAHHVKPECADVYHAPFANFLLTSDNSLAYISFTFNVATKRQSTKNQDYGRQIMSSLDSVEVVENEILINQKEIVPEVKQPRRKDKTVSLNKNQSKALEIYGTHRITRKQAVEADILVFWSDKPCKNGHTGFKYTKSRECRVCKIEANFKQTNPQEFEATFFYERW